MEDERKKRGIIRDQLDALSDSMGMDSYEKEEPTWASECDKYGICQNCCRFIWCKFEFSGERAFCREWDVRLSGGQRITDCSAYTPRGKMSLNQMVDIAVIIDSEKKKVGLI